MLTFALIMFIDFHTHKKENRNPAIINAMEGFDDLDKDQFYSVGIHPSRANDLNEEDQLKKLAKVMHDSNVLAIGECGLDTLCGIDTHVQKSIFIKQIELANEVNKPLVIHCVRAHDELIYLLQKYKCKVPVMIHGFNNSYATAEKYIKLGFFLSFGTSIFNTRSKDVFRQIPIEQVLLETDDSNLNIEDIYNQAALILEMSLIELMTQIQKNGSNLLLKNSPWKI
jgi:TatD DNase family protein